MGWWARQGCKGGLAMGVPMWSAGGAEWGKGVILLENSQTDFENYKGIKVSKQESTKVTEKDVENLIQNDIILTVGSKESVEIADKVAKKLNLFTHD